MSPEERELLTHSIKLAEENNKMLRGMRRSARIGSVIRIIYWIIIIGGTIGAYYIVQPYIKTRVQTFVESYNSMRNSIESVKEATSKIPALPSWLGGK